MPPEEGIARLRALMKKNNERLRFGLVKIVTDGSIQGLSARMRWPGYYDGTPNGVWNIGPDEIDRICSPITAPASRCTSTPTATRRRKSRSRRSSGRWRPRRAGTIATPCSTRRWPMPASSGA